MEFLNNFKDIKTNLILSSQYLDPVQEKLDFVIRGTGYSTEMTLKDSSLKMKLLVKEKIGLYASPDYLTHHGEPKTPNDLLKHMMITYVDTKHLPDQEKWTYTYNKKEYSLLLKPRFNSNDIESNLLACIAGYGIGKFTELNARSALLDKKIRPILRQYNWGEYYLYAVYPHQQSLPKRTRLLLDFVTTHLQNILKKEID
jgi:DNA-binding transcriptional LysR family regulator